MSHTSIQARILQEAARAAGGEEELAALLRQAPDDMRRWIDGKAMAPCGLYIRALSYLSGKGTRRASILAP